SQARLCPRVGFPNAPAYLSRKVAVTHAFPCDPSARAASAEGPVHLAEYLDDRFDPYLRREKETGKQPLAFLVVGPSLTPQSILLAHQYKARTNWDIA